MNEELQSTNEELETTNGELRDRTGELNQVNEFLEVILTSLGVAVTVLDRGRRVQVWNRAAEDLWGVREAEAFDQDFLGLDIGLEPKRLASGPARGDRRRRPPDDDARGRQPARAQHLLRRLRPPPDRRRRRRAGAARRHRAHGGPAPRPGRSADGDGLHEADGRPA